MKNIKRSLKRFAINCRDSIVVSPNSGIRALGGSEHVVFICKGNICRSAFAEKYLCALDNSLTVESFGIQVDKQVPSPPVAIDAGKKFGVDLDGHLSRPIEEKSLAAAGLVLAMEAWQVNWLRQKYPLYKNKIGFLRTFAPQGKSLFCNIYDPYGLEMEDFVSTFSLICQSIKNMRRK